MGIVWANFGTNWATFYFIIWSHCSDTIPESKTEKRTKHALRVCERDHKRLLYYLGMQIESFRLLLRYTGYVHARKAKIEGTQLVKRKKHKRQGCIDQR